MKEQTYHSPIKSITVAQLLLKFLQLEGVKHMFGVPGAANMFVLNELKNHPGEIDYIIARHETGAAYIADGYHRAGAGLGVVMVTSGPGACNALTGAMNAQAGLSSMLVITGEVSTKYFGMGWEQEGVDAELNVNQVYTNAVAFSTLVTSPDNFQTLLCHALRIACGRPCQAAHLSLPVDISSETLSDVHFPASPMNYRAVSHGHAPKQTLQVLDTLLNARRPLIFLGNGCRHALRNGQLQQFIEFVEKFSLPVMTTLDAKAIFPESHELSLRAYGYASCEWPGHYMTDDKPPGSTGTHDCLLVLGSSLGEFSTNKWNPMLLPDGPLIQVDINADIIAKSMPVQIGVVAELDAFIDDLLTLSEERSPDSQCDARREAIRKMKSTWSAYQNPAARESAETPVRPERVMALLSEHLPSGGQIFVDAGNSCGWCMHYLTVDPPSEVHPALDVGAMGYAVGAVIGGKLARPDSTCVAVCGDGGFMMHGAEVSTAAQNNIGAIWLVWNDNNLTMVSQGMNKFFNDPAGWDDYYKVGHPDLVKYAEGLGADAYRIASADEFTSAFSSAIEKSATGKPQVIVMDHDDSAMPPFYTPYPSMSQTNDR